MDNIRATIDVLLTKRNFASLVKNLYSTEKPALGSDVDFKEFKHLFTNNYNIYNGDQLHVLYRLMEDEWLGNEGHKSLLNILTIFTSDVLRVENDNPICVFDHYLRWHFLTASVGEDILTTSYLANRDIQQGSRRLSFAWKPVLTTDNKQLQGIFESGLEELHFHLNGSSLNFFANWLALMNNIGKYSTSCFEKLNGDEDLCTMARTAALLRVYLFVLQKGERDRFTDLCAIISNWLQSETPADELKVAIDRIQNAIDLCRDLYGHEFGSIIYDYAIPVSFTETDRRRYANCLLVGERKFLYDCFITVYTNRAPLAEFASLFYLYIVAKAKIQNAFVQYNSVRGFDNFKVYESSKDLFVNKTPYEELIAYLAAQTTLCNQNIKAIEYRIAPKNTAKEIKSNVDRIGKRIQTEALREGEPDATESIKQYFVLHFLKEADNLVDAGLKARNEPLRNRINIQKEALKKACEEYSFEQLPIVGIDAANSEFGCRPEVFSNVYKEIGAIGKLGLTYHVGEDFYDIVDGLRAVEEALIFLNLKNGSRLGHAIALGLDARKYYEEKHGTIVAPQEVVLDNIVWLLGKMDQYSIPTLPGLRYWLETEYYEYLQSVYAESNKPWQIYELSWMLRGDDPMLYKENKFEEIENLQCCENPRIKAARHNKEAVNLYRRYHFDEDVRKCGHKYTQIKVERHLFEAYIDLLNQIQERMQYEVVHKGVAIETNLTSNMRICQISHYSEHPISKYYSLGLTDSRGDTVASPQIPVSINTDDQGIFATSLEKEYTLLALAMEKQRNAEGLVYNRNSIYEWLENIRKNSHWQSFKM